MKQAVYAGTFDPFTNGHLTIYEKGSKFFDVTIILAHNQEKKRSFDIDLMKNAIIKDIRNVEKVVSEDKLYKRVIVYDGLIAQYCKENNIQYLIRGIRNNMDYQYEEEIAKINKEIYNRLETIYFRSDNEIISSSMVKTFLKYNQDVRRYVPVNVNNLIRSI